MKNLKNLAVAAASLVIFTGITQAQTVKANYAVTAEEPIKVKYLGDDGDYLVFEVAFVAPKTGRAVFVINDQLEGEIYATSLSTNPKGKTVKIEKTDNNQVLNFQVILGNKVFSKSFTANTSVIKTVSVTENSITKL